MKFLFQNSLVTNQRLSTYLELIREYVNTLASVVEKKDYQALEASLVLPTDTNIIKEVKDVVSALDSQKLKYIVVIGIGGSNLGTKAIYDALYGYYDVFEKDRYPKMIFLDTQDPDVLVKTKNLISSLHSKDEIVVNAISKSGGTTETMANLEVVFSALSQKFGDVSDRFVVTTNAGSAMDKKARSLQIKSLSVPEMVGGRYSVFSAVGLFPLMALGVDVTMLLRGAANMRETCVNSSLLENPAALSAAILYHHATSGININDNFIFLPQLESLGKWYRQLMGESVGKDGKGMTPTVSIGSTDLHSMAQLYLGGPKDKITTYIYSQDGQSEPIVPKDGIFGLIPSISGVSIAKIMSSIVEGTKMAYKNRGVPFVEVLLERVSLEEMGAFMQFKMIEMMYLGKLFEVNAFDQPSVELYKIETKKVLEGGGV